MDLQASAAGLGRRPVLPSSQVPHCKWCSGTDLQLGDKFGCGCCVFVLVRLCLLGTFFVCTGLICSTAANQPHQFAATLCSVALKLRYLFLSKLVLLADSPCRYTSKKHTFPLLHVFLCSATCASSSYSPPRMLTPQSLLSKRSSCLVRLCAHLHGSAISTVTQGVACASCSKGKRTAMR